MFNHILVATDGSKLSTKAVKAAARLAKTVGAKLTAVYVMAPYTPPVYGEGAMYALPDISPKRYKEAAEKSARRALAEVEIEAQTGGVVCKTLSTTGAQPWDTIIRAARSKKCDLIVMASHGRRGIAGLLLGSETTKVLTHSKIPVLVCR